MVLLHKKKLFWAAIFIFQVLFGFFYDYTEYKRGQYFNPFESDARYYQQEILDQWNAGRAEGDLQAYNRMAYSILIFHQIKTVDGAPSAWVTPGYPIVLAVLYGLFGFRFFPVVLFNGLCATLAYFFLFQFTLRNFGKIPALICLCLLICNLRVSMFVGYIYTECLFFFLLTWSLDLLDRYLKGSGPKSQLRILLSCSLAIGFAMIVRPIMVGVLPLVLLILVLNKKKLLGHLVLFTCCSILFLGVWVLRNQSVFGHSFVSTNSFYALAEGNQDFYKKFSFGDLYASSYNQNPYQSPSPSSRHPVKEVREALDKSTGFNLWKAQNQKFYAWLITWRFKNLLAPYTQDMSARNKVVSFVLWVLTFPFAIIALFGGHQSSKKLKIALFGGSISLLILPAFAVIGNSLRYQIPSQLLLSPLAGLGWYVCYTWFFKGGRGFTVEVVAPEAQR